MYSRKILNSTITILALALLAPPISSGRCRADLIISFGDTIIPSGGTGAIDVFISSSTGTDMVQLAQYSFEITSPIGKGGSLQFDKMQQKTEQLIGPPNPTKYVFFGDTLATNLIAEVQPQEQIISGSDRTKSGFEVSIGTDKLLLARLELKHLRDSEIGDFRISLTNVSDQNLFFNENGDKTAIAAASFATTNFGTITAVPEPSTLVLCSLAFGALSYRFARRRQSKIE